MNNFWFQKRKKRKQRRWHPNNTPNNIKKAKKHLLSHKTTLIESNNLFVLYISAINLI